MQEVEVWEWEGRKRGSYFHPSALFVVWNMRFCSRRVCRCMSGVFFSSLCSLFHLTLSFLTSATLPVINLAANIPKGYLVLICRATILESWADPFPLMLISPARVFILLCNFNLILFKFKSIILVELRKRGWIWKTYFRYTLDSIFSISDCAECA